MMVMQVSERELLKMQRWTPTEPFTDVNAMRRVIPLPQSTFEGSMTTTQAPRKSDGKHAAKLLPRLPMKLMFRGAEPFPAVAYSDGVAWLLAVSEGMQEGMAQDLMRQACWRLSCRVTRGSRERTAIAKKAFAAYRAKWPADARIQRQPNADLLEPQEA